jgi:tight adherence protein B
MNMAAFLGVLGCVLCMVFYLGILNLRKTKRQQALALIYRNPDAHTPSDSDKNQNAKNRRRQELSKKLKDSDQSQNAKGRVSLTTQLRRAGLKISVKQYWIFSLILCLIVMSLTKIMGYSPLVILLSAVFGLLGIPRFIIHHKTQKRQKRFLKDFGDALEGVVRLLKAGMPIAEAIKMIAREYDGPIQEEMSLIYDAQKVGIPLYEAVQQAAERMPLPEMRMFATGITIQAQTGSSLAEVLTNMANVIRARFKLRRKVKALASEANASASIIGALPILVGTGIYFLNKEWILVLFTDPFGKVLLGVAMGMMLLGVLVMKAMINFKV